MKSLQELSRRYQCMELVPTSLIEFGTEVLNTLTSYPKPVVSGNEGGELVFLWTRNERLLDVSIEPDNTLVWVLVGRNDPVVVHQDIWTGQVSEQLQQALDLFL